jgi:hypothetical protein
MDLLSIFRPEQLATDWAYHANGIVWRVQFTSRGRIVGECRDRDKKIASFFCLDEQSGKPLWKDLRLEEPWWVGVEGVAGEVILLHSYAKPDMPEHKGILAFDVEGGTLRWRNDDVSFWFSSEENVYAYRDFFERRVGYELDVRTGEIRRTFDESLSEMQALRHRVLDQQTAPEVVLPEILSGSPDDSLLLPLVNKTMKGKESAGSIEFIKEPGFLLFNYHVRDRNSAEGALTFENHFFIYRYPQGERIFFDVIGSNLTAYVPDSFFIHRPRIFFIKDQRVLTAIRLWKS